MIQRSKHNNYVAVARCMQRILETGNKIDFAHVGDWKREVVLLTAISYFMNFGLKIRTELLQTNLMTSSMHENG